MATGESAALFRVGVDKKYALLGVPDEVIVGVIGERIADFIRTAEQAGRKPKAA